MAAARVGPRRGLSLVGGRKYPTHGLFSSDVTWKEEPEGGDGEEEQEGGVRQGDEGPGEAEPGPASQGGAVGSARMRKVRTRRKEKRAVVRVISQNQRTAYCMAAG